MNPYQRRGYPPRNWSTVIGVQSDASLLNYQQLGTGAISRTVLDKLREGWVSLADFGADPTGASSSTTAVVNARACQGNERMLFIPRGEYEYVSVDYTVDADFLWVNRGFTALPFNPMVAAETNAFTLTCQTSDDPVENSKLSRVGLASTMYAQGAQHGSAIRANLYNVSTDGNANTAFYGHVQTHTNSLGSFALHGEARHGGGSTHGLNIEMSSFTTLGSFYGAVINNTTASLEAAGATNLLTGASPATHPTATGTLYTGTNNTDPKGGWVRGIHFHANALRAGGNTILIDCNAVPEAHFQVAATAPTSTADIWLRADSPHGLLFTGTYGTSALRISAGARIGLEATNAIKFGWDTGSNSVQFLNGANNRLSLDLSATPCYRVNATKVVGARIGGWAVDSGTSKRTTNATYSGTAEAAYTQATIQALMNAVRDATQTIKALKDDLHATAGHGLIGT